MKHKRKMQTKPTKNECRSNIEIHRDLPNYWGNYMKYMNRHGDNTITTEYDPNQIKLFFVCVLRMFWVSDLPNANLD